MEIPRDLQPTFRPEVGLEVYEGIIDFEVSVRKGLEWDAFRQNCIDEFQEPEFNNWPHVGPDESIEVVTSYAGKANTFTVELNLSIDEFQEPEFDDWPHVGPDTSIEVVTSYAGKANPVKV